MMAKTKLDRIEKLNDEIAQIKKRQALLRQQHNKQVQKDRTHRLSKRGGLVEKLLPDLSKLNDTQFDSFVEKVLLTGHAEKILRQLVPLAPEHADKRDGNTGATQNGSTTAGIATGSTVQIESASAPKPAGMIYNSNGGGNGRPTQAVTQPGGAVGAQAGNALRTVG